MLRYTVEDMTCGHCVQAVTQALADVDAAATVAVDLPSRTVDVTTKASADVVAAAIRGAGYTPKEATLAAAEPKSCCGHCN